MNDPYININSRNIFLTTFGKWNSKNRIYETMLISDQYQECLKNSAAIFHQNSKNSDISKNYCTQILHNQISDSITNIICKKICPSINIIDLSPNNAKCILKNKSKILKEIKNSCGHDEPSLRMNMNIAEIIFKNAKNIKNNTENYKYKESSYSNYILWILIIIILISLVIYISI